WISKATGRVRSTLDLGNVTSRYSQGRVPRDGREIPIFVPNGRTVFDSYRGNQAVDRGTDRKPAPSAFAIDLRCFKKRFERHRVAQPVKIEKVITKCHCHRRIVQSLKQFLQD